MKAKKTEDHILYSETGERLKPIEGVVLDQNGNALTPDPVQDPFGESFGGFSGRGRARVIQIRGPWLVGILAIVLPLLAVAGFTFFGILAAFVLVALAVRGLLMMLSDLFGFRPRR